MLRHGLLLVMLLAAGAAQAQSYRVDTAGPTRANAMVGEQARIDTLNTSINTLTTNYNTMKVAYDRYKKCADMGMIYAPTATSATGYVSSTKCVPFPAQPLVREVRFTTANTTGNMTSSGSTARTRMEGFMNSNGCPTASWHVCTEEEIKYAFARNLKQLDAASPSFAWFMGMEVAPIMKFSGYTDYTTTPYCSNWTSTSGSGYVVSLYNATTTGKGITVASCASSYPVACCR